MPRVNPTPIVEFDGQVLDCNVANLDTAPLVLDDLAVTWGREDYISHATPGVATLSLIDRTGQIAARASGRALIGRRLILRARSGTTEWTWFRGRISDATARPKQSRHSLAHSGDRDWIVELTAAARDADLGQVKTGPETWPTETMIVRANRLADLAAPAEIDEMYFYPGSVDISCWPLNVEGRDLKGLTDEFYMSMGDTYSYHPNTNVIRHIYRRKYVAPLHFYRMADGLVYVAPTAIDYDGQTYPAAVVPGTEATTDDGVALAPNSTVTRVEASWKDRINGGNDWRTVVEVPEGDQNGRRTVTFTSWIDDGIHLDPVVAEVLARGQEEGSIPKHPRVVWDTRPGGGFVSLSTARALVNACETQGHCHVGASMYAEWIGRKPVFAMLGGTIRYQGGGWIVELVLQHHNATDAQTPPTWQAMPTYMQWRTNETNQLAPTVTWWDMRWLTNTTVFQG